MVLEPIKQLLILGLTPEFLEKANLASPDNSNQESIISKNWFNKNREKIIESIHTQTWWQSQGVILDEQTKLSPSELRRKLNELGYEKVDHAQLPGEFASYGNIIDIFPINETSVFKVEFYGSWIEHITASSTPVMPRRTLFRKKELNHLSNLKERDYVVHLDHGIGIFRGYISEAQIRNQKYETRNKFEIQNPTHPAGESKFEIDTKNDPTFFVIEYAAPRSGGEPDKLFIPQEQAKKLSRYIGFTTPEIHRLSSQVWFETKKKVKEDTQKFAQELFSIYVRRAQVERPPYRLTQEFERQAEANVSFSLTQEQERVLEEILENLKGNHKPMDRVLIGDVGFGKTEVAIRVMLAVAEAGMQVFMLAPTTILADQHFQTISERLTGLPVEIALMTRLQTKKEQRKNAEGIRDGKLDIIVGTHRLFGKDIQPKRLGLLIIDEEQRFGVKHKEHFKKDREYLDVLSLSATPIPRTLSFTMSGLREISQIESPPPGKEAIETFVLPKSKRVIQNALQQELKHDGQVYFLENRIAKLALTKKFIQELAPRAKIGTIHGRLPEKELVRTMHDFRENKTQILLATTIIENGLDLSNVNTLIVSDSTRLGLAQAHQLRGRIGRPTQGGQANKAYAYFLYPAGNLKDKARERLRILKELSYLGSGYQIALMDLELRGAGNILGKEQSGAVNAVGLNLYSELLSESMEHLKNLYQLAPLEAGR